MTLNIWFFWLIVVLIDFNGINPFRVKRFGIAYIVRLVGRILRHINFWRLFKAKSCLYNDINNIICEQTNSLRVTIFTQSKVHLFAHS